MPRATSSGMRLAQLLGRGDHDRAVAGHLRRRHHEVNVVRIVAEPVDAHRRVGRRPDSFHRPRPPTCCRQKRRDTGRRDSRCGSACARDGRRRHRAAQPVGKGLGALRPVRRLDGVNVIVDRAGMGRIAASTRSSVGTIGDALRVGFVAARLPVIPGAEIHDGFGVERGDFVVVGKLARPSPWRPHRPRRAALAVGLRIFRIALGQRCDQRLLARACRSGERLRLLRWPRKRVRPLPPAIGRLMLGPSTSASPQKHMAQCVSSFWASRKARCASA